jgi:GTP cyclohydrolase II
VRVDRACNELRQGRLLQLRQPCAPSPANLHALPRAASAPTDWLVAAVETLPAALLQRLQRLQAAGLPLHLLLTAERLEALGQPAPAAGTVLPIPAACTLGDLQGLAAAVNPPPGQALGLAGRHLPAGWPRLLALPPDSDTALRAGLAVCKRARLLPAMCALPLDPAHRSSWAPLLAEEQVLALDAADLALLDTPAGLPLQRVSDARVPLGAAEDCTLVLFREPGSGVEQLAIIVGQPDASTPVAVRLHSACLTGDLLGSLRCDCGPQLQRAVAGLAQTGGVLLYLAQEGRGTGLANKLRAYRLQDAGLDTLQADRYLGFREDERDFGVAAAMLRALGYSRIRLLTNNPDKIAALQSAGIAVVDRLPLPAPVNAHNARYMDTKRQAGHLGD